MRTLTRQMAGLVATTLAISVSACTSSQLELSATPSTPFKLATFEVDERVRIGLVLAVSYTHLTLPTICSV